MSFVCCSHDFSLAALQSLVPPLSKALCSAAYLIAAAAATTTMTAAAAKAAAADTENATSTEVQQQN